MSSLSKKGYQMRVRDWKKYENERRCETVIQENWSTLELTGELPDDTNGQFEVNF